MTSVTANPALVATAPLAIGSVAHLFPHAFLNVLVLVPALIWSMFLLYRGHNEPGGGFVGGFEAFISQPERASEELRIKSSSASAQH